jgi:hypothetical protein
VDVEFVAIALLRDPPGIHPSDPGTPSRAFLETNFTSDADAQPTISAAFESASSTIPSPDAMIAPYRQMTKSRFETRQLPGVPPIMIEIKPPTE